MTRSEPPADVIEALEWALDEIDVLSNRLVHWAYPQAMAMVGREDQFEKYRSARASLRASSSLGGIEGGVQREDALTAGALEQEKAVMSEQMYKHGLSPGAIAVFIHHAICGDPYHGPGNYDFYKGALERLRELDLLTSGDSIDATERGHAFLNFIMATPLPVQRWVLMTEDPTTRLGNIGEVDRLA